MAALVHDTPEVAEKKVREHVTLGFHQIMDGLAPYFKLRKIRGNTYSRTGEKRRRMFHPTLLSPRPAALELPVQPHPLLMQWRFAPVPP